MPKRHIKKINIESKSMKETGFWGWLVKSSSDPSKVSMTVKGALMLWVPVIIAILKLQGTDIPETQLTDIISGIGDVVMVAFGLIGSLLTVVGLLRKFYYSIKK